MERLYNMWKGIYKYCSDTSGAIALMFGIMLPILVGVAGLSIDYSQAYLVKQRLAQAIDAAALAGAASSTDAQLIEQKIRDFFDANYPPEKLGLTFEPDVQIVGDEVIVGGTAQYQTSFLSVLGIDTIDIAAETTVVREVQGIEVVLAMDNTGSMSTNNNIEALRDAASNFVYIMYGIDPVAGAAANPEDLDGMATRNTDYIKVGLVPYSSSVNVGPYGLGEDPDGEAYGTPFVNNPHGLDYTTNSSSSTSNTNWLGCVLAEDYPLDTEDHPGNWDMYRYCRDDDDDAVCHGYWYYGTYYPYKGPNYRCPRTHILPLSTSPSEQKDMIDYMNASGHTYGNYGMAWGYRVLSPDFPFEEGVDWDNQYWRKAIVMMTDGNNTMHPYYSLYGPTASHSINVSDLNDRFIEVCDNMKEEGTIIYTVTFYSNISQSTKDIYEACATSESYYYDAPGQQDLIDAFEDISRELSNLHIKG